MRRTLGAVLLALLTAGLLAGPASARPTPLKGTFVQSGVIAPSAACQGLSNTTTGTGEATHLGKSLWSGTACLGFGPQGIVVTNGKLTLTAANGDQLFSTFAASGALPAGDGSFHLDGTFTVVGGTGRFAGATGGGTFTDDGGLGSPSLIKIRGTLQRAH